MLKTSPNTKMPLNLQIPEFYVPAVTNTEGIVKVEMQPQEGYQFTDPDGDLLVLKSFWVEKLVLADKTEEIYGRGVWPSGPFFASFELKKKTDFDTPSGYNGVLTVNQNQIDGLYKEIWLGVAVSDGVHEIEKSFLYVPVGVQPPSLSVPGVFFVGKNQKALYFLDEDGAANSDYLLPYNTSTICADALTHRIYGVHDTTNQVYSCKSDGSDKIDIYQSPITVNAIAVDQADNKIFLFGGDTNMSVIDLQGNIVFINYPLGSRLNNGTRNIDVDWIAKKIYAVGGNGEAYICNYNGSGGIEKNLGSSLTQGLSVDPIAGNVFVRSYFNLEKRNLDFEGRVDIVQGLSEYSDPRANFVSCDTENQVVYLFEAGAIRKVQYDGTELFRTNTPVVNPNVIASF